MVYEDFHPLDDHVGLVARGKSYIALNEVVLISYKLEDGTVKFGEGGVCIFAGEPVVRLGNIFRRITTLSANSVIYMNRTPIGPGHQPFLFEYGLLCQRDLTIYLNGEPFIKRWPGLESIGRPSGYDDTVLFECRTDIKPPQAGWEIWKYNIQTKVKKKILDRGANPYYYDGKLFYSFWVDGAFLNKYKEVEL